MTLLTSLITQCEFLFPLGFTILYCIRYLVWCAVKNIYLSTLRDQQSICLFLRGVRYCTKYALPTILYTESAI